MSLAAPRSRAADKPPETSHTPITHSFLATGPKTYIVEYLQPEGVDAGQNKSRKDIFFEDFENTGYQGWVAGGSAFGDKPIE